jgi:hypothetical protein
MCPFGVSMTINGVVLYFNASYAEISSWNGGSTFFPSSSTGTVNVGSNAMTVFPAVWKQDITFQGSNCSVFVEINNFLNGDNMTAAVTIHSLFCDKNETAASSRMTRLVRNPQAILAPPPRQRKDLTESDMIPFNVSFFSNITIIDTFDATTVFMPNQTMIASYEAGNQTLLASYQSYTFPTQNQSRPVKQYLYLKPDLYAVVGNSDLILSMLCVLSALPGTL